MLCRSHVHSDIIGSIGGITYTRSRYGTIIGRARVVPVNVNSNPLELIRTIFGAGVAEWKKLPIAGQQSWIDFAAGTPWTNGLGETVYLTGQAMYIGQSAAGVNMLGEGVRPGYATSPCTPGLFPMPLLTFDCCANPDIGVVVTVQNLDSTNTATFLVQISPPQSLGVRFYTGPWNNAGQIVVADVEPGSSDDALFCDLCEAKYFFRVRALDVTLGNNMSSVVFGNFVACTLPI